MAYFATIGFVLLLNQLLIPPCEPSLHIFGGALTVLKEGLVAYYPLDNGNANDESGNNHNGFIRGGLSIVPDRFGRPRKR
jgi:hypothetical protein